MTKLIQFANNAVSNLVSGISDIDTSLTVTPGGGSKFPSLSGDRFFMATLIKASGEMEVIKVTNRVTDTFTFERAAEPVAGAATAYSFSSGDRIELRITAGGLSNELERLDSAAYITAANKSADYTVVEADISSLIRVETTSAPITVTLPLIGSLEDDFDVIVAKVTADSNVLAIAASGSDLINGSSSYGILGQWQGVWLIADRSTSTWTVIASGAGGAVMRTDPFVGDGTPGPFTLSGDPGSKNNTAVFVGGVYQQKSTYTLSGTQLTLGGNVEVGVAVEVNWSQPVAIGQTTADLVEADDDSSGSLWSSVQGFIDRIKGAFGSASVGFTPLGTGAVASTVGAKLQEFISVIDRGADPTGATNSVTNFNNASATVGVALVPPGTYLLNTTPTGTFVTYGGVTLTGAGAAGTVLVDVSNLDPVGPSEKFRTIPSAYSWAGIYPTICQAPGKAQFSENVSRYARRFYSSFIGLGTTYVDPVNGLDTNSGTATLPVKTISKAVRDLNPSLILCLPGVYKPFEFRTTDTAGNKLKIVKALGPCTIEEDADSPAAATWTADGTFPNTYWMPLTPAFKDIQAVLDITLFDDERQPRPLTRYGSIADANGSGFGWFHDTAADRLYVRYLRAANLNTVKSNLKIVTGDATSRILVLGTKLLMEGDWQLSGVFFTPLQSGGVRPILMCEFDSSKYRPNIRHTITHGVSALGSESYFQNAWLHRTKGDGFNYYDNTGVTFRAVEIDCLVTYAGDIDTEPAAPNTSNGSSKHETGSVLRINGEYRRNYGPDVVDTGTNDSWNVGTIAGPSGVPANSFGLYTTGPTMRLDTCAAFGYANADIAATTGGTLLTYATSFRTSSTAGSPVGVIEDYVPNE